MYGRPHTGTFCDEHIKFVTAAAAFKVESAAAEADPAGLRRSAASVYERFIWPHSPDNVFTTLGQREELARALGIDRSNEAAEGEPEAAVATPFECKLEGAPAPGAFDEVYALSDMCLRQDVLPRFTASKDYQALLRLKFPLPADVAAPRRVSLTLFGETGRKASSLSGVRRESTACAMS